MSRAETVAQLCLLVQSVIMGYIGYGHLFKPDGNLSELGFTFKPRCVVQISFCSACEFVRGRALQRDAYHCGSPSCGLRILLLRWEESKERALLLRHLCAVLGAGVVCGRSAKLLKAYV